jgi:hypothetical protein
LPNSYFLTATEGLEGRLHTMSGKLWVLVVLVLLGTMSALATPPALAAEYTDVAGLQPWSAETNYMSLAGYLRWMTFKEQGVWLSMPEAKRIVAEQIASME